MIVPLTIGYAFIPVNRVYHDDRMNADYVMCPSRGLICVRLEKYGGYFILTDFRFTVNTSVGVTGADLRARDWFKGR